MRVVDTRQQAGGVKSGDALLSTGRDRSGQSEVICSDTTNVPMDAKVTSWDVLLMIHALSGRSTRAIGLRSGLLGQGHETGQPTGLLTTGVLSN